MNEKLTRSLSTLRRALDRLAETRHVTPDADALLIDGTIQRFEFTIELFWKTLKRFLEYHGIEASTPRESIRQAYAAGWIDDEALWLGMLSDRNRTSHLYDEEAAAEIFGNVKRYLPALERAYDHLQTLAP